jgi:hypothetical protein
MLMHAHDQTTEFGGSAMRCSTLVEIAMNLISTRIDQLEYKMESRKKQRFFSREREGTILKFATLIALSAHSA